MIPVENILVTKSVNAVILTLKNRIGRQNKLNIDMSRKIINFY